MSCFPTLPTRGEAWILASPGASGQEPLPGFVSQPAPFPCSSVLGVDVAYNLSPSFATPTPTQGAPGLWMGSSSQPGPQVCVACLLCLASCRGFPTLTLLPSIVAGSSLPSLTLCSLPQGPPGVPGPPGPPGMPGLQVKSVNSLEFGAQGPNSLGASSVLALSVLPPYYIISLMISLCYCSPAWHGGLQILGPGLWTPRLILRNVLLCFSSSTPLVGSKPRPGRNLGLEAELCTSTDCTVGAAISIGWCAMSFCLCELFQALF